MMNLKTSLPRPLKEIPSWLLLVFALAAFLGFLDATYLTLQHYLGLPLPCSVLQGCEKVTTSQYATFLGLPVALLGAINYLFLFMLSVIYFDTKKQVFIKIAAGFTIAGFLATLWFLYAQFFIIGALCLYCVFSALISALLFVIGMTITFCFYGARASDGR